MTLSTRAEPRWSSPRSRDRRTFGLQVVRYGQLLGRDFMQHQRHLALLAGERVEVALADVPEKRRPRVPRGQGSILVPAFRDVAFAWPRQSGKTTTLQSAAAHRANSPIWRGPQHIMYSAQNGRAAADKLIKEWLPDFDANKGVLGVRRSYQGVGKEGIAWSNGSYLDLIADGVKSGHGPTLHLALKDERFGDVDDRRDAAMSPAMSTILDAQAYDTSTAGTMNAAIWNAVVARGRMAAERGDVNGMCYQEFSACPKNDDPTDERVWWRVMPALGQTVSIETIRGEFRKMKLPEFCRAYLNVPIGATADDVFGAGVWERGRTLTHLVPAAGMTLAVDIRMDRGHGFIAAAVTHPSGSLVEVVSDAPALSSVVDEMARLWQQWRIPFHFDSAGPAGAVAAEAAGRGVAVVPVTTRTLAAWCGSMFDAVAAATPAVVHPAAVELDSAVAVVQKRKAADAFVWDRKAAVDPSPFIAATLARGALIQSLPANYDLFKSFG